MREARKLKMKLQVAIASYETKKQAALDNEESTKRSATPTKRSATPTKESSSKSKHFKDKFTREITKTAIKKRTEKERREDVVKAWKDVWERKKEKNREKKVKLQVGGSFSVASF